MHTQLSILPSCAGKNRLESMMHPQHNSNYSLPSCAGKNGYRSTMHPQHNSVFSLPVQAKPGTGRQRTHSTASFLPVKARTGTGRRCTQYLSFLCRQERVRVAADGQVNRRAQAAWPQQPAPQHRLLPPLVQAQPCRSHGGEGGPYGLRRPEPLRGRDHSAPGGAHVGQVLPNDFVYARAQIVRDVHEARVLRRASGGGLPDPFALLEPVPTSVQRGQFVPAGEDCPGQREEGQGHPGRRLQRHQQPPLLPDPCAVLPVWTGSELWPCRHGQGGCRRPRLWGPSEVRRGFRRAYLLAGN